MRRMSRTGVCSVVGCEGPIHAKGKCHRHYRQSKACARRINLCRCGCGELTEYVYKHGHHTRLFSHEEQVRRGRMNTGDALRDRGSADTYRKVGKRHEHRAVAEKMIGRPLMRGEVVHHKNKDKRDNRPENLEVLTQSEHAKLHMEERRAKKV